MTYSAPFPFICQTHLWNNGEFEQLMLSESQFLSVPMATEKTENQNVGDVVFLLNWSPTQINLRSSSITHVDINMNLM